MGVIQINLRKVLLTSMFLKIPRRTIKPDVIERNTQEIFGLPSSLEEKLSIETLLIVTVFS